MSPKDNLLYHRLLMASLILFSTLLLPVNFLMAQPMGKPGEAGPPPEFAPAPPAPATATPPQEAMPAPVQDAATPITSAPQAKQGFWAEMMSSELMIKYQKGGPCMHGITLTSIVGLAIVFERLAVIRRKNLFPKKFVETVNGRLNNKTAPLTFDELKKLCTDNDGQNGSIGRILLAGAKMHHAGFNEMCSSISNATSKEAANFEANMSFLGLMSNMAPLLGFLGTVTGMIAAFESIAKLASTRPEVVGGGISEALITTAYGLFIGIPLVIFYYHIKGRIDSVLIELEETAVEIVEQMTEQGN